MKKRITEYRKRVDRLLADEEEKTYEEWECILEEHLVQIGFFQHVLVLHQNVLGTGNGYICCDNGTVVVCSAFDGDHDTLWFYHAAPCASCAVYFSLLYT